MAIYINDLLPKLVLELIHYSYIMVVKGMIKKFREELINL